MPLHCRPWARLRRSGGQAFAYPACPPPFKRRWGAANTAANITAYRLGATITGLHDLPGKVVGTADYYVDDLGRRGVPARGYPWNNAADEDDLLNLLMVRGPVA